MAWVRGRRGDGSCLGVAAFLAFRFGLGSSSESSSAAHFFSLDTVIGATTFSSSANALRLRAENRVKVDVSCAAFSQSLISVRLRILVVKLSNETTSTASGGSLLIWIRVAVLFSIALDFVLPPDFL